MFTNKISHKKIIGLFCLTLLVASMVLLSVNSFVSATTSGTFNVYQRDTTESSWSYPDGTYTIGSTTFQVSLTISDAADIWGWGIDLVTWNPDVVNLTKIKEGTYLRDRDNGDYTTLFAPGVINNTVGALQGGVGDGILGDDDGASSLTAGELCYFTFLIVGTGDANIQFTGATLTGPALSDGVYPKISLPITSPTVTVIAPVVPDTGKIDAFTDKGGIGASGGVYRSLELVKAYTRLLHSTESVEGVDVSFVVTYNGTQFKSEIVQTNSSGYASFEFRLPPPSEIEAEMVGIWIINASATVSGVFLNDTVGFTFTRSNDIISSVQVPSSVHKLENISITIPTRSLSNFSSWHQIDITLFDHAQIPINSYTIKNSETPVNDTYTASIFIPQWAFNGEAIAYICLLSENSTALAAEVDVNFTILDSISTQEPTSTTNPTSTQPPTSSPTAGPFPVPEYAWAGIAALFVCFAAFLSFYIVSHKRKSAFFNKFSI
ncbi:MAG: hypothetical protein NWF01_08205 [Candidatus Bathyarchaeota archaeon]|nr:hypothetical protein [Candidatus Bathyarchaeota archaeon]